MVHVTWGVVIACGKTEQMSSDVETPFLSLGNRPILACSLAAFEKCPDVTGVLVVVSKERVESVLGMAQMYGFSKVQKIINGSTTRHGCMHNVLKHLEDDVSILCVHDASRPCVTPEIMSETIKAAKRYGSGVSAVQIPDAVKQVEKGLTVSKALDGGTLWSVQTPQTYKREVLEKAYAAVSRKKVAVEDDSSAVALTREEIHLVESSPENIKIRTPVDFNVVACLMKVDAGF